MSIAYQRLLLKNTSFNTACVYYRSYSTVPIFNQVDESNSNGRPQNPAYFTGNPQYFALLQQLNALIRKHNIPFRSTPKAAGHWQPQFSMTNLMHMRLKKTDYTDLVHRLNLLYAFQNEDPAVKSLLQKFVPIGKTLSLSTPTIRTLDADGRSYTIGSRKTARAQCWIVPGNGQVYVNGIRLPEYFRDMVNREVIVKPFEVANCLMKYNTWAIVSGGGHSGQAQAVAVAVARGIAIHDSTKENLFKKLGMLMIDTRQVERKKTGQPGARKKNTWVRR